MGTTNPTPGPWTVKLSTFNRHVWQIGTEASLPGCYPTAIAETAAWIGSDSRGESEANARLIASAPDLLAALKGMVGLQTLADRFMESTASIEGSSRPVFQTELDRLFIAAQAAIAKAEGESTP